MSEGPGDPASMPPHEAREQARIDRVVLEGPGGTFAVAGLATAIVLAIYVLFYLFVYLPRGAVQ